MTETSDHLAVLHNGKSLEIKGTFNTCLWEVFDPEVFSNFVLKVISLRLTRPQRLSCLAPPPESLPFISMFPRSEHLGCWQTDAIGQSE